MSDRHTVPAQRRAIMMLALLVSLGTLAILLQYGTRNGGVAAQERGETAFSYPIGDPGRPFGDGFFIRHGYATENTWYLPGHLHTGEDWYRVEGDTAGAGVYAVGEGEVVFAGSDYPGRVVIVRHDDDLFSMYGHLDPALAVDAGDKVARGDMIGTVLARGDDVPNHLHFEMRTFFTTPEVNGDAPRYDFGCGVECPPGPGYWPIDAPDHPSELGWLNPTHVISGGIDQEAGTEVVVAAELPQSEVTLHSEPDLDSEDIGELNAEPGSSYRLLEVHAGAADTEGESGEAYDVWYQIALNDGESGWVRAVISSSSDTGSDGRSSSVRFVWLPVVAPDSEPLNE